MAAKYNDSLTYNSPYFDWNGRAYNTTHDPENQLDGSSLLSGALEETSTLGNRLEEVGQLSQALDKAR